MGRSKIRNQMKRWEMSKGEREAWDEDQLEIDRRKAGKAGKEEQAILQLLRGILVVVLVGAVLSVWFA